MTLYVVTGWIRHGTSMMMRCLEAGGLEAAYDAKRDASMNRRLGDGDYQPNEDGFMELSAEQYKAADFPGAYEGKLVKCLRQGVLNLPSDNYRMIYMRRDGEECRQSVQAIFSTNVPADFAEMVERETARIMGIMQQRRDCRVSEVWYRDAVERPRETFTKLAADGWPIDPVKAAAMVDPSKYRFRREQLAVGA